MKLCGKWKPWTYIPENIQYTYICIQVSTCAKKCFSNAYRSCQQFHEHHHTVYARFNKQTSMILFSLEWIWFQDVPSFFPWCPCVFLSSRMTMGRSCSLGSQNFTVLTCICMHIYIYIYIHIHVLTYVYTYIYICVYIHTCIHIYMPYAIGMYISLFLSVYIYIADRL